MCHNGLLHFGVANEMKTISFIEFNHYITCIFRNILHFFCTSPVNTLQKYLLMTDLTNKTLSKLVDGCISVENNNFWVLVRPCWCTNYHHGILVHPMMVVNQKWEVPQSSSTNPNASFNQYMFIMSVSTFALTASLILSTSNTMLERNRP
jgi:hypothetical protein